MGAAQNGTLPRFPRSMLIEIAQEVRSGDGAEITIFQPAVGGEAQRLAIYQSACWRALRASGDWPIPRFGAANRDGTLKLRPPAWRGSQRPAGVSRTSLPGVWRQMRSRRNSPPPHPLRERKSVGEAD